MAELRLHKTRPAFKQSMFLIDLVIASSEHFSEHSCAVFFLQNQEKAMLAPEYLLLVNSAIKVIGCNNSLD